MHKLKLRTEMLTSSHCCKALQLFGDVMTAEGCSLISFDFPSTQVFSLQMVLYRIEKGVLRDQKQGSVFQKQVIGPSSIMGINIAMGFEINGPQNLGLLIWNQHKSENGKIFGITKSEDRLTMCLFFPFMFSEENITNMYY